MSAQITENKTFEKEDYSINFLPNGEYEECTFINCIFSNSNLSSITFRDCVFNSCDFSLAQLNSSVLDNIKFINCKLLGVNFDVCNDFLLSVYFEKCQLKLANFYKLKLKKTKFINCNLQETDFTETDLTASIFENCDLLRTIFLKTNLEKVDFRTSINYSIDLEVNKIKKARFSRMGIIGLLDKYDIDIE